MRETINAYRLIPTVLAIVVDATIPPIITPMKLNSYACTFIIYEDLSWKLMISHTTKKYDGDFCFTYYIQWKFKSNNIRTIINNNRENERLTTIQQ